MMQIEDIQKLEYKIVKVVYDTLKLTQDKITIPQKMIPKHNQKGYSRYNPALNKLYEHRLDALIIEYIKTVILYAFYNDVTDLTIPFYDDYTGAKTDKKQKLIDFNTPYPEDERYRYERKYRIYESWRYQNNYKTPLVFFDLDEHTVDLAWLGYARVGTKFEYDFKRDMDRIMPHVYEQLKDNAELMCWLVLAGAGSIFDTK